MKYQELFDGDEILKSEAFKELEKPLIDLIARTSMWVDPGKVTNAPVYPDVKRGYPKQKGQVIDGIRIDDNTYANRAIKNAISKDAGFVNYVTCHIWPGTTYDERYHTRLANLVLIPQVVAALSDHCPSVIDVLKYRAFELYGWYPEEESEPERPDYYPEEWGEMVRGSVPLSDMECNLDEYFTEDDHNLELEEYNNNREEIEIEKVRRKVLGWRYKPGQICSTILDEYMTLSQNGKCPVERDRLKSICEMQGVEKFEGNYNQMKNFGLRNHAKVFQENNGYVSLWLPVSTFIKGLYK